MNINFVVVVVVVSFQRVTFTFQLHVNPRMFQIEKKKKFKNAIKNCMATKKRTKKNKKEQKNRNRNNKKMWLSFSNIIVDNITVWTDTVGKGVTEKNNIKGFISKFWKEECFKIHSFPTPSSQQIIHMTMCSFSSHIRDRFSPFLHIHHRVLDIFNLHKG